MRRLLGFGLATLVLLAGCGGKGDAVDREEVSPDFFGVVADDVFAGDPGCPRRGVVARCSAAHLARASDPTVQRRYRELMVDQQKEAGVGLLRQTLDWSLVETKPGSYDFERYDTFVAALAERRIAFLPILFNPPPFHSARPDRGARRGTYPPSSPRTMAQFATAAVRRYGSNGSFWRERPELPAMPVTHWQVWNEPGLPAYWPSGPDSREYTRLLEAVSRGIKEENPNAQVVTAGLPTRSRGSIPLREFLHGIHAAGGGDAYDILAVHVYAPRAEQALADLVSAREVLTELGKDAPLWVTEWGWATGGPPSPFTVSEQRQSELISYFMAEAIRQRVRLGLRGIVYYRWRDAQIYPGGFDFFGLHTGLLDLRGRPKPGLAAFARATRSASE